MTGTITTGWTATAIKRMLDNLATHTLKMALIKASPTASFNKATALYSDLGTDEVTGTGYTAGGITLTGATVGQGGDLNNTSWIDFTDPAWTTATFSAAGGIIYDVTDGNRVLFVFDFGGTLSPAAGTLTVVFPAPGLNTAALRLCT